MSAGTTIDQATRLARAIRLESMRLENVLINASAVPIPIDLMPSALAAPIADSNAAASQTIQSDAAMGDAQAKPQQDSSGGEGNNGSADVSATSSSEPAPDAVLSGLQAARDAIHDSLRQDGSAPTQSTGADALSSINPDFAPQALHSPEGIAGAVGNLATADPLPVISAGSTGPLDIVAQVAQGIAGVPATLIGADPPTMNLDGQPDAAPIPMALVAQAADVVNDAAALVTGTAAAVIDPIHDLVQAIVPDASQSVQSVAQSVQSVVQNVQSVVQSVVQNVVQDAAPNVVQDMVPNIVQDVTQNVVQPIVQDTIQNVVHPIVQDIVQDVSSAAPILLASAADVSPLVGDAMPAALAPLPTAIADAVTVPSLGGAGVDALVGLLQPPPLLASAAQLLADPAPASLQDIPTFAPIGVDHHVADVDPGAAHAVHSALHLVGSGLI